MCITNLRTHIVTCCIHLRIHLLLRIPFPFLRFQDFVVYVAMTPVFSTNQSLCTSFSKNGVTLFLSFKRVTTARNLLIDSHHYKRNEKTFRPQSLTFHPQTTQLNPLFLKTLNYSKTIQRLVLSFRNLHSFYSNATKT